LVSAQGSKAAVINVGKADERRVGVRTPICSTTIGRHQIREGVDQAARTPRAAGYPPNIEGFRSGTEKTFLARPKKKL